MRSSQDRRRAPRSRSCAARKTYCRGCGSVHIPVAGQTGCRICGGNENRVLIRARPAPSMRRSGRTGKGALMSRKLSVGGRHCFSNAIGRRSIRAASLAHQLPSIVRDCLAPFSDAATYFASVLALFPPTPPASATVNILIQIRGERRVPRFIF